MKHQPAGFVLVEVMLASFLFLLLVVALGSALLYGQESTVLAGNRARAIFLAEEGLEAVRNIRDEDYTLLTNGVYGLADATGTWTLSGSSDVSGEFTRTITISDAGVGAKEISSEVTWTQTARRLGDVILVTHLSDWTVPPPPPPAP